MDDNLARRIDETIKALSSYQDDIQGELNELEEKENPTEDDEAAANL